MKLSKERINILQQLQKASQKASPCAGLSMWIAQVANSSLSTVKKGTPAGVKDSIIA